MSTVAKFDAPKEQQDRLLLRAREAAALLNVSARTLWSLTKTGDVRSVRIGRSVRYAPADLEAFVASRKGV